MPRLLLVAATTGYQTRSFAEAARRNGVDLMLATDRCHILDDPWRDHAVPIRFEEPDASADILAEIPGVEGIVAVGDRPTLVAALTAHRLGLPWHPADAVLRCRSKKSMREAFAASGLPVPANSSVPIDCDPSQMAARVEFPCVLKPLGLSASRGVIRANSPDEFIAAFARIRHILSQPEIRRSREVWNDAIQIESYIPGAEFAVEGIMTGGNVEILAIFDKPDPLEGPFFEESIYTTPSRLAKTAQDSVIAAARHAVRALGLKHGPFHAEMRVNDHGVFMLEVAARPIGGLCARALRFEGGYTLEDVVVLHALRRIPYPLSLNPPATGVMMVPVPRDGVFQSVEGIDGARATEGIDDVVITAIKGQHLVALPEGASYTGFLFASGKDAVDVEAALRTAHARLTFHISPALDVLPQSGVPRAT